MTSMRRVSVAGDPYKSELGGASGVNAMPWA